MSAHDAYELTVARLRDAAAIDGLSVHSWPRDWDSRAVVLTEPGFEPARPWHAVTTHAYFEVAINGSIRHFELHTCVSARLVQRVRAIIRCERVRAVLRRETCNHAMSQAREVCSECGGRR